MKKKIRALIYGHNSEAQGIFIPADTDSYVDKLVKYARVITIIESNQLQGFIAYYRNDPNCENAFLSMLLVAEHAQGKGIGQMLLSASIEDLKKSKFKSYQLEVLIENRRAVALYEKFGFRRVKKGEKLWLMENRLL